VEYGEGDDVLWTIEGMWKVSRISFSTVSSIALLRNVFLQVTVDSNTFKSIIFDFSLLYSVIDRLKSSWNLPLCMHSLLKSFFGFCFDASFEEQNEVPAPHAMH
jgi:hypothetical protein